VLNAVLMVALCPEPPVAVMKAGAPTLLVSEKLAGVATPLTDAATEYVPKIALAVKVNEVANPCAVVVAVLLPPENVPLARFCAGTANVTVTPFTGLCPESVTRAISGDAKAVLTPADCPDPLDTVMNAGDPGWLVKEKLAGVATPAVDAVTR
jgi:hypothetical protein